jgi:signal peptidase II
MSINKKIALLVTTLLLLDQASKIWVKTNMVIDDRFSVLGDWFYIHFIENPGMAFGLFFGGAAGKVVLTLFRVLMSGLLIWYLSKMKLKGAPDGFMLACAAIFAGAVGNTIDCVFYGLIFSDSVGQLAQLLPPSGGYAPLFLGHVVDMLSFPMIESTYPSWIPFVGGKEFVFFRYIFNIADSSVFVGTAVIFLFYQKTLKLVFGQEKTA